MSQLSASFELLYVIIIMVIKCNSVKQVKKRQPPKWPQSFTSGLNTLLNSKHGELVYWKKSSRLKNNSTAWCAFRCFSLSIHTLESSCLKCWWFSFYLARKQNTEGVCKSRWSLWNNKSFRKKKNKNVIDIGRGGKSSQKNCTQVKVLLHFKSVNLRGEHVPVFVITSWLRQASKVICKNFVWG